MRLQREMPWYSTGRCPRRLTGMARPMVVLLLALALVGVGAITREEKKAKKQLRKAENLQNRARARDSLVRDSAHLGKII